MNTVLVVLIYVTHSGWVPQYTAVYKTQEYCMAAAAAFKGSDNNIFYPKAVCLPQVESK